MGDMLIEGSHAVLRLDGDGRMYLRKHGYDAEIDVDFDWENKGFAGDSVYFLLCHVVQHVLAGVPVMNTARDYLKNLRIEDAIYRSSESGAREKVLGPPPKSGNPHSMLSIPRGSIHSELADRV